MAHPAGLLDLPTELILQIVSYLDLRAFLSFTSTCRALHDSQYLDDHQYWSSLLRETFRVPNQPVLQNDGRRERKLFKRMQTQTRLYTWGDNSKCCLGHSVRITTPGGIRGGQRKVSWPEKMEDVDSLGVISDLQCGGWSTTLLTAKGALHTVGVVNGLDIRQGVERKPHALSYPPGFPHPSDRYDSSTAIKQFSCGRAHILGLTDSGWIWSWHDAQSPSLRPLFVTHDRVEHGQKHGEGGVLKVVAGWNKSAALVKGVGIVLWDPLRRPHDDTQFEDAVLLLEDAIVPKTSFAQSSTAGRYRHALSDSQEDEVGEVRNFIVLEQLVVFNTHLGKAFVAEILWNDSNRMIGEPFQLPVSADGTEETSFVTDVQGSFQSFGVFTSSGEVLTSKQERVLDLLHGQLDDKALFTSIPALQRRNVVQLAFGDYHFHALHSDGRITSYGSEPQSCGALGLGGHGTPEGRLRGVRYTGLGSDGRLIPHAYAEGRQIWFEREKRAWIDFLTSGGVDPAEAQERIRMALGTPAIHCQGEVSEWVEQQGRDWEQKYGVSDANGDGLSAYFALSVSAAGWHSGALVLENPELVEKLKHACEVPDPTAPSTLSTENSSLGSALSAGLDWGRWALGYPPYDAASASQAAAGFHSNLSGRGAVRRGDLPMHFGAAPREGWLYKV